MTDHRMRTTDPFVMAIRAADGAAELGRLRAIVAEIYAGTVDAREGLMGEIDARADVLAPRR